MIYSLWCSGKLYLGYITFHRRILSFRRQHLKILESLFQTQSRGTHRRSYTPNLSDKQQKQKQNKTPGTEFNDNNKIFNKLLKPYF